MRLRLRLPLQQLLSSTYPVRPECSRSECIEGSRQQSHAVAVACEVEVEVEVEVAVNPRQMATRRWRRNRIKKRPLFERSEFRTLPDFGASGVCSPRSGPPS